MLGLTSLTNILLPRTKFVKIACLLLFLVSNSFIFSQTSVEDTKKQANKYFEDEDYNQAYKLYSQLVSNFPKDVELNFKLGVCMIYSEPDKKKCLPYLKLANSSAEAPKETKFYLGKAYHINYLFDEAIKSYNDYKKISSSSNQKKLQVDREIRACGNGKRLLSNLSDLEVQSKKELNEADYFRSYDLKSIGGKLLVKPEDFKTNADKKKKDKSVVYLPKLGDRVYFSSYGENTDNGRDIFYKVKLPNGTFGPAVKVNGINTEFDEDYPFLHPNGKTLYFASKGFNSMGGYDIFRSTYNEGSDSWSLPENMEFPINSPDDDYLFVTDSLEKIAYFSTGRQSMPNKIDVLKVKTERKPIDIMAIKGSVLKESSEQSLLSKISIKNIDNGQELGTFNAENNGDYLLNLPNGAKLLFTVETPGLKTQSQGISLPLVQTSRPFKQAISYEKGILKIINYFEEAPGDDSYLQYLKIIESKAKLDVNAGQNNLVLNNNATAANTTSNTTNATESGTNTNASNTTSTSVTNNSITANTSTNNAVASNSISGTNSGLNNKELSKLAKKDAEDSKKEAEQFTSDANDAFELGETKKIEAEKKIALGNEELKKIENITNEEEKEKAKQNAIAIKNEGESELEAANKILTYASNLKDDAAVKIKEADLNNQYANELEKVINSKNPSKESLNKLDELQKEIEKVGAVKIKSESFVNDVKGQQEEKEKEITSIESNLNVAKQSLNEINNDIKTTEDELNKAKKKNKPEIQTKLNDLKSEKIEKEKQIADYENKLAISKGELASVNNQLETANKIKNETISTKPSTVTIASANTATYAGTAIAKDGITPSVEKNIITNTSIQNKYADKINSLDVNNKTSINENTTALKNYNKDIDAAIVKNKTELTKAKTQNDKTFINENIKLLEQTKNNNQQQIIANNKALIDLNNTTQVTNNSGSNTTSVSPISLNTVSSGNNSASIKELDKLNSGLNYNDAKNFEFNSYQNQNAQQLKIQADAKINEASAQQNTLKDKIAEAKTTLSKSNSSATNNQVSDKTPNELNKEAEDLTNQSIEKLDLAKNKEGDEKKKLLKESDDLQKQSNEKSLQASIVMASDNKSTFETNNENIDALLKDDKAVEADKTTAKTLNEEAKLAFIQAKAMREEANSQTNIGAKLGGYTNAEEKEAEGLAKQKKAVELLKNANVNFPLKEAVTSVNAKNKLNTNATNTVSTNNNSAEQIAAVNKTLGELVATKKDAYQKLSEANQAEAQSLIESISTNQNLLNTNPALKTEFVAANSKLESAKTLKQNAETAGNDNDRLTNLINATKKEIEAINQLNKLNTKLIAQANKASLATNGNGNQTNQTSNPNNTNGSANTNTTTNQVANNNAANNGSNNTNNVTNNNGSNTTNNTNQNSTQNGNSTSNTNNGNQTANNINSNTNQVATNSGNSNGPNNTAANTQTLPLVDVNEVAKNDTTPAQTLNAVKNNATIFTSPAAKATISNAITELESTQNQLNDLNNGTSVTNTTTANPTELKTKATDLINQADELNVKAFDVKAEANSKSGEEKQKLLDEANKIEQDAMAKKMEAAGLNEQSNSITTNTNNQAINEMLKLLKTDNADLANVLEQKNNDIKTLANQVKTLREEANALTNGNAKLGALSNVEEKEIELIQKQTNLINELKKTYPNYVMPSNVSATVSNSNLTPEQKAQKQTEITAKQNQAMVNLVNAYSIEYEAQKNSVPQNLNTNQTAVKQNAEELNTEAKRLLIQASQVNDENQKNKLLAKSAKLNATALTQLTSLNNKKANSNNTSTTLVNNTNPRNNNPRNNTNTNTNTTNPRNNITNNTTANNTTTNPRNNTTTNNPRNNTTNTTNTNNAANAIVKVEGLEVIRGNAYNANKPIPINAQIPDGLVFRVQLGAFKTALPNNAFKGLNPLNGETTSNGYIRYTAGNFNKLENANAVKNDLRNLGYSDAFVVVYYNGKRILLNEALAILEREGKTVDANAPQSAGITANTNVPRANTVITPPPTLAVNDVVVVTKELEKTKNLLYTVQIGVYSRQISWKQLLDLKPIYTEKLSNGLYRYTAGIYNNGEKVILDKRRTAEFGIDKPFVSAYLNGKRVDFNEYRNKQATDSTIIMEQENPIVFPGNAPPAPTVTNTTAVNTNTTEPFKNDVTSYPEATPENGIKAEQTGVCFKVQIGAYSKQVPNDVAAKFSSIKNWPVENKLINGLYIYNVGNYVNAKSAKVLRDEVVKLGVLDAFISVYKDGVKLFGAERQKLMEEN